MTNPLLNKNSMINENSNSFHNTFNDIHGINKLIHRTSFKPTLNQIPKKSNKMKNKTIKTSHQHMRQNFKALSFSARRNPQHMIFILRTNRLSKLIYKIQKRYQNIKNKILNHKPSTQPYKNEICLFVFSHGSDTKFYRKPIHESEELFENVRIFGLKDTNRVYPAALNLTSMYTGQHIKVYHDYQKIITELLSNETFSYSMKDRERLIESTFKTYYSHIPRNLIEQYHQTDSGTRYFINPPIGNFRPVLDHKWSLVLDPEFVDTSYPTATFLALKTTKQDDIDHTCAFNADITNIDNNLFKSPFWAEKLGLNKDKPHILLSELVRKLKEYGYEHIHIIDISCRGSFYKDKEVLNSIKFLQHRKNDYTEEVTKSPIRVSQAKEPKLFNYLPTIKSIKGGASTEEFVLKSPIEQLKDYLIHDLDKPLSETYMYQIYKKIIPETKPDEPNKKKAIYTWYFMILLGYYTEIYEREYGAEIAVKGGRSIQLLIDGNYKSDDLDIKVLDGGDKPKQEIARLLSEELTQGLPNLSVLKPGPRNEGIYKISLSENGFIPLVDIDFRELSCDKGPKTIECRLKNILTHVEPTTVFVDGLDFMEDTILSYNTYPITIQITEKMELIREYDYALNYNINHHFKNINEFQKYNLIQFFYSFFDLTKKENDPSKLAKAITGYSSASGINEQQLVRFIQTTKLSDIFYLEKFNRALKGLQQMTRKERENEMRRATQAIKDAEDRLNHRKELFKKIIKAVKSAAAEKMEQEAIRQVEEEIKRLEKQREARIKEMEEEQRVLNEKLAILQVEEKKRKQTLFQKIARTIISASRQKRADNNQKLKSQTRKNEKKKRHAEEEKSRKLREEQQATKLKNMMSELNAQGFNEEGTKKWYERMIRLGILQNKKKQSVKKGKEIKK